MNLIIHAYFICAHHTLPPATHFVSHNSSATQEMTRHFLSLVQKPVTPAMNRSSVHTQAAQCRPFQMQQSCSRVWCNCAKQGGCDPKAEASQITRLEAELYQRVYASVGPEMGSALCTCSIVPCWALIRKSNNINM